MCSKKVNCLILILVLVFLTQNVQAGSKTIEYDDGKIKARYEFIEGGTLHGSYIVYYPNGNFKTKGRYSNGNKAGTWQYFNEDGSLLKEEIYNDSGTYEIRRPNQEETIKGYEKWIEDNRVCLDIVLDSNQIINALSSRKDRYGIPEDIYDFDKCFRSYRKEINFRKGMVITHGILSAAGTALSVLCFTNIFNEDIFNGGPREGVLRGTFAAVFTISDIALLISNIKKLSVNKKRLKKKYNDDYAGSFNSVH